VRDRRACLFAARALRRIARPVETSSLDDLRATVKEPRSKSIRRFAPRAVALTTPHPSPTMKSVPCMLQRVARCIVAVAGHGSLIANHQSLITGHLNV
jgi:hypothetical protein